MAYKLNWPVYRSQGDKYSRGEVATLIAYLAGKEVSADEAIQYLLDRGLAKGKTSNTVTGFGAKDSLTRAEAVTFIKNVKDKLPSLGTLSESGLKLFDVALGDTEKSIIERMGEPGRKEASGYGFTWYIYNGNYEKYAQIGMHNGKVVALFSNAKGAWNSPAGIRDGIKASELSAIVGETIGQVKRYGYSSSNEVIEYFLDNYNDNRVDAILLRSKTGIIGANDNNDNSKGNQLASTYERQVFDLTNVFRQKNGIGLLEWDDLIADTARKHSQDMSKRDYFDHTNPEGQSPFDRMKANGISYSSAAENIASGYDNAFDVYNGWLNSSGHRKNMLNNNLQRLGVGIYDGQYTQNFYTPR